MEGGGGRAGRGRGLGGYFFLSSFLPFFPSFFLFPCCSSHSASAFLLRAKWAEARRGQGELPRATFGLFEVGAGSERSGLCIICHDPIGSHAINEPSSSSSSSACSFRMPRHRQEIQAADQAAAG